jgi:putative peptidoglycan lipid II flippase
VSTQLLKSTGLVSGLTLISRILGFVRDMVIAGFFGASAGTDAFFVAFKIPNFLRRLFAEGAFAQAFVPVLSSVRALQAMKPLETSLPASAGVLRSP